MTNRQMFNEAHAVARIEARRFGISYRKTFGNALCGFQAVARGFRGVDIIEPARVWA